MKENPDLRCSFSPLDGRTPTSGGRLTYTLSPHITSKKIEKEKSKKKVKKDKISRCAFLPLFLLIFPLDFVFSSISAANIHRITRANVKWAGDDGHHSEESTHDIGEALEGSSTSGCNFLLSFSSFSLLSVQLISTESHGRTSNGRATAEPITEQRQEERLMNRSVSFFVNFFKCRG
jgi:hypothetical protein